MSNIILDEKKDIFKSILLNTFTFLSTNTTMSSDIIKNILLDKTSHKSLQTLLSKFSHLYTNDNTSEISINSELISMYSNHLLNLRENNVKSTLKTAFVFLSDYSLFSSEQSIYSSFIQLPGIINSVSIQTLSLNCSIFNITSSNNTFFLFNTETNLDEEVKLKIGYYTNTEIELHINNVFKNKHSLNCILRYNKDIQRFSIKIDNQIPSSYSKMTLSDSLSTLLGYSYNVFDFSINEMFISDYKCSFDIFNNLYFQIYFNEFSLPLYSTNSPLQWYSISSNKYFYNQTLEFTNRCDSFKIAHLFPSHVYVKVFDKNFNLIKDKLSFSITFSFS
jgi:hypothetical protein